MQCGLQSRVMRPAGRDDTCDEVRQQPARPKRACDCPTAETNRRRSQAMRRWFEARRENEIGPLWRIVSDAPVTQPPSQQVRRPPIRSDRRSAIDSPELGRLVLLRSATQKVSRTPGVEPRASTLKTVAVQPAQSTGHPRRHVFPGLPLRKATPCSCFRPHGRPDATRDGVNI
jgi:hypothetical protein